MNPHIAFQTPLIVPQITARLPDDLETIASWIPAPQIPAPGWTDMEGALRRAAQVLSSDWLELGTHFVYLDCGTSGRYPIPLRTWAEVLWGLDRIREQPCATEQIRRLCLPSIEKLNTGLVFQVVARYSAQGFDVRVEPNGPEGADLLVHGRGLRVYLEVKRETSEAHQSQQAWFRLAFTLETAAQSSFGTILKKTGRCLYVRLGRLCSLESIPAIVHELSSIVSSQRELRQIDLAFPRGSQAWLLDRSAPNPLPPGMSVFKSEPPHSTANARSTAEPNEVTVVISAAWTPNWSALKSNIKKGLKQLELERDRDPAPSRTMLVAWAAQSDEQSRMAMERLVRNLPEHLLGIMFLGPQVNWRVGRTDLSSLETRFMDVAGQGLWGI